MPRRERHPLAGLGIPTSILEEVVLADADRKGCTCDEITIKNRHASTKGIQSLRIGHDLGCPALDQRTS
jgi:hypothetical protein